MRGDCTTDKASERTCSQTIRAVVASRLMANPTEHQATPCNTSSCRSPNSELTDSCGDRNAVNPDRDSGPLALDWEDRTWAAVRAACRSYRSYTPKMVWCEPGRAVYEDGKCVVDPPPDRAPERVWCEPGRTTDVHGYHWHGGVWVTPDVPHHVDSVSYTRTDVAEREKAEAAANASSTIDALREAGNALIDVIATPKGRDFRQAWEHACMLYGRFGEKPTLLDDAVAEDDKAQENLCTRRSEK